MPDLDAWVPLAEVARPHGVRGELRLKLYNASSDTLLDQRELLLRLEEGEQEVSVERARRADDAILLKLRGVDDREGADKLRGALVCVRRSAFPPEEEGEFYAVDIVGADVRFGEESLGEVVEVMTYPTTQALRIRARDGGGDWEIPLTDAYVGKVDTAGRLVEIITLDELERLGPKKPKEPKVPRVPKWKRNKEAAAAAGDGSVEKAPAADGEQD